MKRTSTITFGYWRVCMEAKRFLSKFKYSIISFGKELLMIVFIYDNNDWVESTKLFPHDIALLVEMKEMKVYLWFGPFSKKELRVAAEEQAQKYMQNYKDMKLEVLNEQTIPLKLQAEIEELLGENRDFLSKKIPRTLPMSLFYYCMYSSLAFLIISVLNLFRMLQGDIVGDGLLVNSYQFHDYFVLSEQLVFVSLVLAGIGVILGIWSEKLFLTASAAVSFVISLGFYFYIGNREFLFYSLPTTLEWNYLFEIGSIIVFFVWTIVACIGHAISTILANRAIKNTTEIVKKEVERVDMGILNANDEPAEDAVKTE